MPKLVYPISGRVLCFLVNVIGLVVLVLFVSFARNPPLYDEPYYLATVPLLEEFGLSVTFLKTLPGPAGPLYTVVHYLCAPVTHLQIPWIRLVNVFFLLSTIVVLNRILTIQKSEKGLTLASSIIAVPMTWVIAGMALTEMPAMFFMICSVLFLILALEANREETLRRVALAIAGGLSLGVSVLGRQPFLTVLLALPILVPPFAPHLAKKNLLPVLTFFIAAIILPSITFYIWQGLVPPRTASVSSGISIKNGLLSFSYAALVFIILAPRWFHINLRICVGLCSVIVLTMASWSYLAVTPMNSIAQRFLGERMLLFYSLAATGFLIFVAGIFVSSTVKNAWDNRKDVIYLFVWLSAMLTLATSAKVTHQFSSRYTATCIPLLLLLADRHGSMSSWQAVRVAVGISLGVLSLSSYFKFL